MTTPAPTRFCTDYAKRVAKCQKCKMQLEKGLLRMGKIVPNFFLAAKDSSKPPPDMKQYFHTNCLFEMLFKARPTTKVIDDTEEIEGFEDLNAEDQTEIQKLVDELTEKRNKDGPAEAKTPKKSAPKKKVAEEKDEEKESAGSSKKRSIDEVEKSKRPTEFNEESEYNSFYKFVQVRGIIKDTSTDDEKSNLISSILQKKKYDGDLLIWLNFLLPSEDSREYKVTDEQLVKYFSKILDTDEAKIQKYVKKSGDVALSIGHALEKKVKNEKSGWSIQKIDRFLGKLAGVEEDEARVMHFKFAAKRMNHEELEVLIRLIRKENDTEADVATILKGIHAKAPKVYEETKSLDAVVEKYYTGDFEEKKAAPAKKKAGGEPKAKKSRRQQESDDDESEVEQSESEDDSDVGSDSDLDGEEEISGSDSDEVSEISSDEEGDSFKENAPRKPAKGTRTRPRTEDGSVVKKPEPPEGWEACRYGAKCYRKNTEHLERFWHPEE